MRALVLGIAVAAAAATAFGDDAPAPADLHAAAEAAVKSSLIDPDSAEFRSEGDAVMNWMKNGIFGRKVEGPINLVCGQFNSKNRMGGYSGYSWFFAAFKDGKLLWTNLDDATDPGPGVAYYTCKNAGVAG